MNMRKMKFLLATLLIAKVSIVMAGPADPNQRKAIKLDDGTMKIVQLIGDEYGYCWKSLDNGICYREIPGQKDSYVEVSELDVFREASRQRRAARRTVVAGSRSELGYPCTHLNLKGSKRVLALLVEFPDISFSSANASEYRNFFNATNYTTGKNKGSVKKYFLDQSNNQLELNFDVVGPVRLSKKSTYYGKATETANDAHAQEMVYEALELANHQVDFSQYDWEGNGTADMIVVIFAGLDQSTGGTSDNIWAHKGNIDARFDNVDIKQYACASELRKINNVEQTNSIGTICHEMSHAFGLPDTYDTTTGNYGTKRWDIMGIGVHNDDGYTPAGYTAYDKMFCLWQSPIVLREDKNVSSMRPMSEGGDFYLIPNDACEYEFFLLENRQQTGWDNGLPGHGMLVMHVDYDETLFYYNIVNRIGTISGFTNDHERMGLVLADNDTTINMNDYYIWQACQQGDLYPHKSNNSLTNTSTPAAKLFHKNIDDTNLLSKPVTNIKENGDGTISFRFANGLASQAICHLTSKNEKFRFMSDTDAKLVVDIKNDGYVDFAQKIGLYVYTNENGKLVIQQPRYIQKVSLSVGETRTLEFPLSGLTDGVNYYAYIFYYKEPNATSWSQMGGEHLFNMGDRNKFVVSMDEETITMSQTLNTVKLEATFHNESYRQYNRGIGLYTYINEDGKNIIQAPRAFVAGDIDSYSDKRLSFTLGNLKEEVEYSAYFFYYSSEIANSWTQMSGPFKIVYDPKRFALGDANGDGTISILDVVAVVNYILGRPSDAFVFKAADINGDNTIGETDVNGIGNIVLGKDPDGAGALLEYRGLSH